MNGEKMGRKIKALVFGAITAVLLDGLVPATAIFAAQAPLSADGTIAYISRTVGFPTGNSGNYKVRSRDISGSFTSGDLSGDYLLNYQANLDLNTQAQRLPSPGRYFHHERAMES
jgi:hypothetical protein